jgi:two-component system, chemotaxis family, protein-glutamate methylesterase/glutaminase
MERRARDNGLPIASPATVPVPSAIVIGASSGGVAALLELAAGLPPDLPAVVGVVLHVGSLPSILPQLLTARSALPAVHPQDGDALRPGTIYVAPPDRHMLFTPDGVRLSHGPRENHARPAIDPLFRTAALHWRERTIGVVLSGQLDDGTAGLKAIKDCGGTALVQDPVDAVEPAMPTSALANVAVDHCLPVTAMAPLLLELVGRRTAAARSRLPEGIAREQAIFERKNVMENLSALAEPSALTCPDCGGGLWELKDTKPLRYRCHTGHAFTAASLEAAQTDTAEHALWSSVRALQERELLLRRLATVAEATGDHPQAEAGRRAADRVREQTRQLSRFTQEDDREDPGGL